MAKTSALVLTLFGFALRLIQLDAPSVGPAEAVNGLLARRPIAEAILLLAQNARPPLYNIGLHLWAVTGQTDFALRLLSALAGALTVSVVFALARELFGGNRIPFVAALLIALAPYQIANAQSAQATAWFGLTCAAASWSLARIVRLARGSRRLWAGYALLLAAALYLDTSALFLIAAHGLWLWLNARPLPSPLSHAWERGWGVRPRIDWAGWIKSAGAACAAFLLWLVIVATSPRSPLPPTGSGGEGSGGEAPLSPLLSLHRFLLGTTWPGPLWAAFALLMTLAFASIIAYRIVVAIRRGEPIGAPGFCLLLLSPLPYLGEGSGGEAAPPLILLAAWAIQTLGPVRVGRALVAVMAAMMLVGQAAYHLDPAYAGPPTREATTWLEDEFQPGDLVLQTSPETLAITAYYAPSLRQVLIANSADQSPPLPSPPDPVGGRGVGGEVESLYGPAQPLAKALAGARRVWLMLTLTDDIARQVAVRAQIEHRYLKAAQRDFGAIQILRFNVEAVASLISLNEQVVPN